MKRGRSQVLWRYTPGALFRYNESGGWSTTTEIMQKDSAPLSGALLHAVRAALERWNAIGPTAYPDPALQPAKYVVGEPHYVIYDLWPLVFTCRACGRVHYYGDLATLNAKNARLGCTACKGSDQLRQIPYGYVHECGRIDTLFVPRCTIDSRHPVELVNKGGFQESFWRCQTCRKRLGGGSRAGLGLRSCECGRKRLKRGVPLEDSRTFYSQNITLVEVQPSVLEKWHGHPRFGDLLLGAALRIAPYQKDHLATLATRKPGTDELSPELAATRELLVKGGMSAERAESIVRQGAKAGGADAWAAYDAALAPFRGQTAFVDWSASQRTMEYVFVRDESTVGAIGLDQLAAEARAADDPITAERYDREARLGRDLGLAKLSVVQALPVLLGAIGYTRYFSSPTDAADADAGGARVELRPFPSKSKQIPIFVARNTTEALLYEMDPWRLAAFLEVNTKTKVPHEATASEVALRAWLLQQGQRLVHRGESHLVPESWEIEEGLNAEEGSALLFGVVHTISHILKATAHRYVGIDADSLAEYLFPAHGAGLLYVSAMVEFTLGGIDSVFRANLAQWLGSARDYAGRCSFDPVCSHDGGACHACLYPKFGCAHFNRTVSRAFLFGGEARGFSRRIEGFWMPAIAAATEALRKRAT